MLSRLHTHEALVSEADFVAVQHIRAARCTGSGGICTYLLAGLVRFGVCHRWLDLHWTNRRPGYRCRRGQTSICHGGPGQPRNLYIREDDLLADV